MRIGLRFAVAFAASLTLLLGGYGIISYRMEEDDLLRAAEQEVRTLSRSAQVAVENALRDDQLLDVRELVERVEIVHPAMDLVITTARAPHELVSERARLAEVSPNADRVEIERVLREGVEKGEAAWAAAPSARLRQLAFVQPLRGDAGELLGAIVVARQLADVHRDLERTRRWLLGASIVVVLFLTMLALLLTHLTVSRPLAQLALAMRRVRAGDMGGVLPTQRADEVGALIDEFNEMVEELRAAKQSADEEAEKRRTMQRSLERADKLAAIGQLAAGLAHEIGTPLHVVTGRARALYQQPADEENVRRVAAILIEQTERITRVVQQLLRYARQPQAGVTLVEPAVPIRTVLDLLEVEAKRRGVVLALEVAPDTPRLMANADQLQQLTLNLVRNSLSATSSGGRIDVIIGPAELSRACAVVEPAVRIEVRDDGCGIPEADMPRLFEPFFTTHDADEGTGLGLAVVRSIVEHHRGTIDVSSPPGGGASFIVLLPVRGPTQEKPLNAEEVPDVG